MKKQKFESSTGRRKTSVAQVRMSKGEGKLVINAKPAEQYFAGCERYSRIASSPIVAITGAAAYDYTVKVNGGGIASQAGAVRHAIARALAGLDIENRKIMKKAGFLTRDSRMVERKKPGQPKARRRFQFSKR